MRSAPMTAENRVASPRIRAMPTAISPKTTRVSKIETRDELPATETQKPCVGLMTAFGSLPSQAPLLPKLRKPLDVNAAPPASRRNLSRPANANPSPRATRRMKIPRSLWSIVFLHLPLLARCLLFPEVRAVEVDASNVEFLNVWQPCRWSRKEWAGRHNPILQALVLDAAGPAGPAGPLVAGA